MKCPEYELLYSKYFTKEVPCMARLDDIVKYLHETYYLTDAYKRRELVSGGVRGSILI